MKQKCLAVGIILLFIGTVIVPSNAQSVEKSSQSTSRGHWLYVGGSGPGNYTTIQDAIYDAASGDTIFVYHGIYDESLIIPKSIYLIGESRDTTIIANDSNWFSLIFLWNGSSNTTISGFTLKVTSAYAHSVIGCSGGEENNDITISNNTFQANNTVGINIHNCDSCSITHNQFYLKNSISINIDTLHNCFIANNFIDTSKGGVGISLVNCYSFIISNNSINGEAYGQGIVLGIVGSGLVSNNTLINNSQGIVIGDSWNLSINSNRIENTNVSTRKAFSEMGVQVKDSSGINIQNNFISDCQLGIFLENTYDTHILKNTFMKNNVHARFFNCEIFSNYWNRNYWGRPRILPKPIFGIKYIYRFNPFSIEFDLLPAQKPYDIPGMK